MKKLLLFALFIVTCSASKQMLIETPYVYVQPIIGQGKAVFLEVGSDSCYSCQKMGQMLYKVKKQHPSYQIFFINVKRERQVAYKLGIQMIPTQLIFDAKGDEIYRHIGVLSSEQLTSLLHKYF